MSALTIDQLLRTAFVECGLAFLALFIAYAMPKIKRKADHKIIFDRSFVPSNNPLVWVVWPYRFTLKKITNGEKITKQISKPMYMKTWVFYYFGIYGLSLLTVTLLAFSLITSVGFKLPFLQYLFYNLVFATASGTPNGAHITSYLSLVAVTAVFAYKTKDILLGGLAGALLVGIHEGFWLIFYYLSWGQYIVWPQMETNILKDFPVFSFMIICFCIAFFKYKPNTWAFRDFKPLIYYYLVFLALWVYVPHLIDPGYYGLLPIRTANLPSAFTSVTTTIFNETKYYWNIPVNLIEVFSWVTLAIGEIVICVRKNIVGPNSRTTTNAEEIKIGN